MADAVHLAFAKRVRHITRVMEVLPADFAWVVFEVWQAWLAIGTALQRLAVAQGMACLQLCV